MTGIRSLSVLEEPLVTLAATPLGALRSAAAEVAKDNRDRSLAEAVFAFATTAARCVLASEPSTSIHVRSGRACRCEPMTAGAVGPHLSIGKRGPLGNRRPLVALRMTKRRR